MDIIHINEFFGSDIKAIITGSEALLAARLHEYSSKYLGKQLSIEGLNIQISLLGTAYFSILQESGIYMPMFDNRPYKPYDSRKFFSGNVEEIEFVTMTDVMWEYDVSKNMLHNIRIMGGIPRANAYINLLAYFLVMQKVHNTHAILRINNTVYKPYAYEYSDLYILKNYGNKLITDDILVLENRYDNLNHAWEAYNIMHKQWGYMSEEYSATDKYKRIRSNYGVGDVMLYYTRTKCSKNDTIKRVKSCYPAVLREITTRGVSFTYYPCVETELTRTKLLQAVGSGSMYTEEDYKKYPVVHKSFDWVDIGVDRYTYMESAFLLDVLESDGSPQWLEIEEGEQEVFLSTADTIYAVFEDRGVKYNKQRFYARHFKKHGIEPVWETMGCGARKG